VLLPGPLLLLLLLLPKPLICPMLLPFRRSACVRTSRPLLPLLRLLGKLLLSCRCGNTQRGHVHCCC
jgi:hypothetical protein